MSDSTSPAAVAVLGLGAMGSALAGALLDAGHRVTVWNRTPARAEPLAARGAAVAPTAEQALAAAPLAIVCLLDYASVREALDPAAGALAGRVLANLTNGTPEQARAMADWAARHGAAYLDGGIMATPSMIGGHASSVLYSGAPEAFEAHRAAFETFGEAVFLGPDPGAAPLNDLALLTGMYGMLGGFLHATALVGADGPSASEFTAERLIPWLSGMMQDLPEIARQIDTGDTPPAESNLAMQAAGYVNLIRASQAQGVRTDLIAPMGELLREAVARGRGDGDLAALHDLLTAPTG
ncbi:NAD(P)-binding domain-containing protein [Streptomyces sp. DSM 44917]|uniref:NAD(P)-binding domain-containing protein n=1 Tax=Streptomyces boetiae TaxID=3075541 RepID=A0ABU2LF00_9ACTN|nr:NAD(P)-binding domain-containing protein [Streptomyces sp. DSM 44917]MDT0309847.1 NAD(P)-binding domain-containing protein [Streptomyces sp. DSM 44917]